MKRTIQLDWILIIIVLFVCAAEAQAPQEKPPSIDSLQGLNASLEQLTTRISPAVVHIEVTGYGGNDDDETKNQTLTKERGSGSGVIVDPDGYIITAYHVIEGARRVRVQLDSHLQLNLSDGKPDDYGPPSLRDAKIVGTFKDADVAVLKIEAKDLPTVSFSEADSLKQGQLVAVLGSPEGLRNSVSLGVVSAVTRQVEPDDFMEYVQTDASQAPGSSGGPLVDIQGKMVGIIVFSLTDRGKHEGLGFAVPSAMVRLVYDNVREFGYVPRAYIAAEIQGVTPILAAALHLPRESGVIVTGATPGTSAEKESLQPGDVLMTFDGARVRNVPQLNWALLHKRPGDHVGIEVWRKSRKIAMKLPLTDKPPDVADALVSMDIDENLVAKLGIVGSARTREPNRLSTGDSAPGVLVAARLRGSDAQGELVAGDVIRSVNSVPITSVGQLRELFDAFKPGDAIALQIERKGKPMYIAFEMD